MHFELQPELENELLILRPLKEEDFEQLYQVASDPLIWEQHPSKDRCRKNVFEVYFKESVFSRGAFAVVDRKTGKIIGSTRFRFVKDFNNAIEIGWTFLARQYWGGYYNLSMKRLMMDYAFRYVDDVLFFINENNIRSQKAIEKIGGERIIQLENHRLDPGSTTAVIYRINKNQRIIT
jgi:N-acetyltransferase